MLNTSHLSLRESWGGDGEMLEERRCIEDIYFDVSANKTLDHPKRRRFKKNDVTDAHAQQHSIMGNEFRNCHSSVLPDKVYNKHAFLEQYFHLPISFSPSSFISFSTSTVSFLLFSPLSPSSSWLGEITPPHRDALGSLARRGNTGHQSNTASLVV